MKREKKKIRKEIILEMFKKRDYIKKKKLNEYKNK